MVMAVTYQSIIVIYGHVDEDGKFYGLFESCCRRVCWSGVKDL